MPSSRGNGRGSFGIAAVRGWSCNCADDCGASITGSKEVV